MSSSEMKMPKTSSSQITLSEERNKLKLLNRFGLKQKRNNFFALLTSSVYMNYATITKYMNVDSEEFGTLIAESIDFRERNKIREYHKFLSELSPSQISKVVSSTLILLILIHTSS